MEDMIIGLCPQCGHTLHIPAELASFSCMYCGARLTKEQLAAEPPAAQEADEEPYTTIRREDGTVIRLSGRWSVLED